MHHGRPPSNMQHYKKHNRQAYYVNIMKAHWYSQIEHL